MTSGQSESDRPKHARWLNLERGEYTAELIVWDTGEAESGIGGPGTAGISEHHEISSVAQLEELLARLVNSLRST